MAPSSLRVTCFFVLHSTVSSRQSIQLALSSCNWAAILIYTNRSRIQSLGSTKPFVFLLIHPYKHTYIHTYNHSFIEPRLVALSFLWRCSCCLSRELLPPQASCMLLHALRRHSQSALREGLQLHTSPADSHSQTTSCSSSALRSAVGPICGCWRCCFFRAEGTRQLMGCQPTAYPTA